MFTDLEIANLILRFAKDDEYRDINIKGLYRIYDINVYKNIHNSKDLTTLVNIYCEYIDNNDCIFTAELIFEIEHVEITSTIDNVHYTYPAIEVHYLDAINEH